MAQNERKKYSDFAFWRNRLLKSTSLDTPHEILKSTVNYVRNFFESLGPFPKQNNPSPNKNPLPRPKGYLTSLGNFLFGENTGKTDVSGMCTKRGFLTAYWRMNKWREAFLLSAAVIGLTYGISKLSVVKDKAIGSTLGMLADFHDATKNITQGDIGSAALVAMSCAVAAIITDRFVRHMFTQTLHRKFRDFHNKKFNSAFFEKQKILPWLQLDNMAQRVQEAIKNSGGGVIGLPLGFLTAAIGSVVTLGVLAEISQPVDHFNILGYDLTQALGHESWMLILGTALPMSIAANMTSLQIGKFLQKFENWTQDAEAAYREGISSFLNRSFTISATGSEEVESALIKEHHKRTDKIWAGANWIRAANGTFSELYLQLTSRFVSYALAFPAYSQNSLMEFGVYATMAELTATLLRHMAWGTDVMDNIAYLGTCSQRVSDAAKALEKAYDQTRHAETDTLNYAYLTQAPHLGIHIKDLKLFHESADQQPFLIVPELHIKPGDRVAIQAPSGAGKTCFAKSLFNLWLPMEGKIILPNDKNLFFVPQDSNLPPMTLKQLVTLPHPEKNYNDAQVKEALIKAGLGDFRDHIDKIEINGKTWGDGDNAILSGGQKKRVALARIILHKPKYLIADELTSGLDPKSIEEIHRTIKAECNPEIVLSILHNKTVPDFYNRRIMFTQIANDNSQNSRYQSEITDLHIPKKEAFSAPLPS